jgi:hypothetical protein
MREEAVSGRKWIITIGIDTYQNLPSLRNAVNDAHNVQRLFETLGYVAPFEPLINSKATSKAINTLILDQLRHHLQPDDTLVLFFAGHGAVREDERGGAVGFLAPVEAGAEWSNYLRIDTLLDEIGRLPALHILVIIDTCYSGHALGGTFARQVTPGTSGRPASRRALTSARAHQLAQDGSGQQINSPFTSILLDAFTLQDNDIALGDFDQDGSIIGIELGLFVQLEFGKTSQYKQMPDFGSFHHDERGEFVVASVGTPQKQDDPLMISHLRDAQRWLQNKGDRAYLYRGGQLSAALAWRARQQDTDIRDEVDIFLNAARHWRRLRRLAVVAGALLLVTALYLAGAAIYRWRLMVDARTQTVVFQRATVRLGVDGKSMPVNSFRLDVHEVSARQYWLCYRASQCGMPAGMPDYKDLVISSEDEVLPVVSVSMFNARDYCAWQGGRLPTIAEWEYAVRGLAYRTWPWGEDEPTRRHININLFNTPDPDPFSDRLVAVQDPAYEDGVTDEGVWHLLGNAREWTGTLVTGCPHDEHGRFVEVHQCAIWDGSDSALGLFAAGLSYRDDLVPEDAYRVSEFLNLSALAHDVDLGFRCAYDYEQE